MINKNKGIHGQVEPFVDPLCGKHLFQERNLKKSYRKDLFIINSKEINVNANITYQKQNISRNSFPSSYSYSTYSSIARGDPLYNIASIRPNSPRTVTVLLNCLRYRRSPAQKHNSGLRYKRTASFNLLLERFNQFKLMFHKL